ncbi:MAG: tetratricopeptide repeat protein, partial [Nostoc sp.]
YSTLEIAEHHLILHQLARSEQELGDVSKAQEHYQQALNICPAEDEEEKAGIIHNLGYLKANRGEINEALALYKKSLTITEQIGNVQGQAMTLSCLGYIAEQQGNYNQSLDYLQPALEILQRIQSPDAEEVRQAVTRVQDLICNS